MLGAACALPLNRSVAVRTMRLHRLTFSGAVVQRGFWLYAGRVEQGSREFFYVGCAGRIMPRSS